MSQPFTKKNFAPGSLRGPRSPHTLLLRMAADDARAQRFRETYEARKADNPANTWKALADHVGRSERAAQAWAKTGGVSYENAKKAAEFWEVDFDWLWRGPQDIAETPDPFQQTVTNDADLRLANLEAQVAVNTALLEVIAKHLGVERVNEQVEEALAQPPRRIPESLREALRTAADRLRAQETHGTQGSSRQAG